MKTQTCVYLRSLATVLCVPLAGCMQEVAASAPLEVGTEDIAKLDPARVNGGLVSERWGDGIINIGIKGPDGTWRMQWCGAQVVARDGMVTAAHCIRQFFPKADFGNTGITEFAGWRRLSNGRWECITGSPNNCRGTARWWVPDAYKGIYDPDTDTWTKDNESADVATLNFTTNFVNIRQRDAAYLNAGSAVTFGTAYGYAAPPDGDGFLRFGHFQGIRQQNGGYRVDLPESLPHLCGGDSGGPLRILTSFATTPESTVRAGVLVGVNSKGGCNGSSIWAPILPTNRRFIERRIGRSCRPLTQNGRELRDCW